jgi:hypothetical protein
MDKGKEMSDTEEVQAAFPDRYRDGMTLRDYFAAQAMQGIMASGIYPTGIMFDTAKEAYEMADAMMKAREA